jgi:hypothetical protein
LSVHLIGPSTEATRCAWPLGSETCIKGLAEVAGRRLHPLLQAALRWTMIDEPPQQTINWRWTWEFE